MPATSLLTAMALLAAGCGGSATTTSTNPAPADASRSTSSQRQTSRTLAPASLIASADQICRRVNSELAAVTPSRPGTAEEVRVVKRHAAIEHGAVTELARLGSPVSFASTWQKILSYRRTLASYLDTLSRDTAKNQKAALNELGESKQRVHRSLGVLATQVGFKDCSQVG